MNIIITNNIRNNPNLVSQYYWPAINEVAFYNEQTEPSQSDISGSYITCIWKIRWK